MDESRKNYIRRLVSEIREQIAEDPRTIEAKESFGEEIIVGYWLNIALLCDVIEEETRDD